MICTEEEAKKKSCFKANDFNANLNDLPCCVASGCMAWVETSPAHRERKATGYCGLIAAAYTPSSTI